MILEIENIVASGTKINIDYYLNTILDEDAQEEIYDYFLEDAESDEISAAFEEFDGDLNDYSLRILKNLNKSHPRKSSNAKAQTPGAQRQLEQKKIKQLKNEIHSAEKRLKRLQEKIAGVEAILQSPDTYDGDFQDDLHDLIRNQTELKAEIEEVEQIWLNLNEQLEGSI